MKASMRNDKGSCNHNDRSFSKEKAEHLNKGNVYVFVMENDEWKKVEPGHYELEKREKERYKELFGKHFDSVNQRYREQGHGEKVKTLEQHRKGKHAPIETIFQIGKEGEWKDPKTLITAVDNTLNQMKKTLGNNLEILSMSLHCDEKSIHIHVRWMIMAHDKDGNLVPDKENGLAEAGIELPSPDKKKSKYNNRIIRFTDTMREYWYDEADKVLQPYDKKINRETDPKNRSRRNKKVQEYRAEELGSKIIELEQKYTNLRKNILNKKIELVELIDDYKEALNQATNDYERYRTQKQYTKRLENEIKIIDDFLEKDDF